MQKTMAVPIIVPGPRKIEAASVPTAYSPLTTLSSDRSARPIVSTRMCGTLRDCADKPGLTGAHLLITDTPTTSSPTTEQQIRGSDGAADWIVLLAGYDGEAVRQAVADRLSSGALHHTVAQQTSTVGRYNLAFTMTPLDLAAT
jgi:hypothetical protein